MYVHRLNVCIVTWINRKTVLPKPLKKNRKTIEFSRIATGNLRKNVPGFRSGDKILQSSNVFDFFLLFSMHFWLFFEGRNNVLGMGGGANICIDYFKSKKCQCHIESVSTTLQNNTILCISIAVISNST